jgi:GcrA cell cycle regulator
MTWTQEDSDAAATLWRQGLSAMQIGIRLRKTRNAVIGKIHRLGFTSENARETRRVRKARPGSEGVKARGLERKLKAKRKAAPVFNAEPLPAEAPMPKGTMQLADLEAHHCRYIYGDVQTAYGYCGCEVVAGLPYCEEHARICYVSIVPTGKAYIPRRYIGQESKRKREFEDA